MRARTHILALVLATTLGHHAQAQHGEQGPGKETTGVVDVIQGGEVELESSHPATAPRSSPTRLGEILAGAQQRGTLERVLGTRWFWVGPPGYSTEHRAEYLVTVEGEVSGERLRFVTEFWRDDKGGRRRCLLTLDYAYDLQGSLRALRVTDRESGEVYDTLGKVVGDQILASLRGELMLLPWHDEAIPYSVALLVLPALYEDLPGALRYESFDGEDLGLEGGRADLVVPPVLEGVGPHRPRTLYLGQNGELEVVVKFEPDSGAMTELIRNGNQVWRSISFESAQRQLARARPGGPLGRTSADEELRSLVKQRGSRIARVRFEREGLIYAYYRQLDRSHDESRSDQGE